MWQVINNNFALAVSYQRHQWEERRFFIMFDTCDVWLDGEVAMKLMSHLSWSYTLHIGSLLPGVW